MSAPELLSRFGGFDDSVHGAPTSPEAIELIERPACLVQVTSRKGKEVALAAAIREQLGLELPVPNYSISQASYAAYWLQPNCWLIEAPPEAGSVLVSRLANALAGIAAVVDQSHGRCILRLSGSQARAVLARCCRLDFHPRVFSVGRTVTTLVAHVSCTVRLIDEAPTFDLIVGSTFAIWLVEELLEASAAFGCRFIRANQGQPT